MPANILQVTKQFTHDPVHILVKEDDLMPENIKQFRITVENEDHKLEMLCELYGTVKTTQTLLFCKNSKVVWLTEKMKDRKFAVSALHDKLQEKQMMEFRSGSCPFLIATEVSVRGIDIPQVSVVVNYDLPAHLESYIHRVGRAGRFGRK